MNDLNRVQLIGHVGQDPEVTYTATGTARTTFRVASGGGEPGTGLRTSL